MKIPFKAKVIASYITIVVFSFGLMALFVDRSLESHTRKDIARSLTVRARLVASQIPPALFSATAPDESLALRIQALGLMAETRVTAISTTGVVLADSGKTAAEAALLENHLNRPEIKTALAGSTGTDIHHSNTLKKDMLYVAVPVVAGERIAGAVRLSMPLTAVEQILGSIRGTIFAALACALILAAFLGWILASRTILPVNRMIHTAKSYGQGDFSKRTIVSGHDEIGTLAQTLNAMAQKIEDMIREASSQNQTLTAIFNSMIEGVIVVDKHRNIHSVNHAIEKIFGITQRDVKGRAFLEAIRNNDISSVIDEVLRAGITRSGDINLVLPVRRSFQINAAPVFHHREVIGCLIVIHDVTEIRRLETIRQDFVANVSHELKTPLTSIRGFTETLLEGALDDRENSRSFLQIIQDHADRLNELVNDLLSLSHLESKEMSLSKTIVDMRQEVEKIVQGFAAQLNKQEISAINNIPAKLLISADRGRIGQVLTNLIDNAIKFNTAKGKITISGADTGNAIRISVEDSGAGIPLHDMPRIFERFYRVDKARSRDLGGTGLGLAIAKHIVELHGGSIGVESTEGHGSRFWFTLPQ